MQTVKSIRGDFQNYTSLKALLPEKIIGSIKLSLKDETCHIERLVVEPELQNRGVGSALLDAAFKQFPDVRRYELFTGEKSEKNIHL